MAVKRRRHRRLERRGRPRKPNAKRRQTTAAGRAASPDPGSPQLRQKKLRTTTRPDVELNAVGVLFGRNLLDIDQYNVLTQITLWLERLQRSWGGTGGVTGLWRALTGAAVPTGFVRPQNAMTSGLADAARRALERAVRQLDGSRSLVVALAEGQAPPLVLRAIEGRLSRTDKVELERLRQALDALAGRRINTLRDHPGAVG